MNAPPPARPSPLRRVGQFLAVALLVSPFWRRSVWRRLARVAVVGCYAYVGVLLVLLWLENSFLYQPTTAAEEWLAPPAGVQVEDVELTAADGTPIHGWWAAPEGWTPAQGAVLFCHGNAGNVSGWGQRLPAWCGFFRTGVLVFDFPGYGKSRGRPSEAGCYAAADAAHDWLTAERQVRPERVVLVGRSLGASMAIDLASRRPCRALIVYSAFSSFPDLAQEKYPWLPARWLVCNRFDNLSKIAHSRGPVFVAHGAADAIVPFAHGERLFAAAPAPKRFFGMDARGHNDDPTRECDDALRRFLAETAPPPD